MCPANERWRYNVSLFFIGWAHPQNDPWRARYGMSFSINIWVRSRNCGCLVTWFCYLLIAKPGNKTDTVPWPDPYDLCSNLMHFTQRHGVLIDHTTTGQNDKDVFFEENVSENIISIIPVMTAMLQCRYQKCSVWQHSTHSWEIWIKFKKSNFQANFSDWWLRYQWWKCPQMIVTGHH